MSSCIALSAMESKYYMISNVDISSMRLLYDFFMYLSIGYFILLELSVKTLLIQKDNILVNAWRENLRWQIGNVPLLAGLFRQGHIEYVCRAPRIRDSLKAKIGNLTTYQVCHLNIFQSSDMILGMWILKTKLYKFHIF